MDADTGITRRDFIERVGGGVAALVVAERAGAQPSAQAGRASAPPRDPTRLYPQDFNAYLVVGRDGRVVVFSPKIEMGQGVLTSQAQMVAEEMDVDLDAIDMVLGDTDRCPWDMGTFGSMSTRFFGPALRAAAAQARVELLALAAQALRAPADRLVVAHGIVSVADEPGRRVSYGELARGARITAIVDRPAVLRAAERFIVMGRSPTRLDAREKVTGTARYTADLRRPGMLYARLLRPPVHGAKRLSVDTRDAEAMPGVRVVQEGDLVAVLHADPGVAAQAIARVAATWQRPESTLDRESIFEHLQRSATRFRTIAERGDAAAAAPGTGPAFGVAYLKGYVAHAAMETHAALAEVIDGRMIVQASTQTPFPTRDRIAQQLGLATKDVRVVVPYVGGGFGGKSASEQAVEAARLARATGRPVQVARTRAEEFFLDTFDPACVVRLSSRLDGAGRIASWDGTVFASGERGAVPPYDIPRLRVRVSGAAPYEADAAPASPHPLATGPWRAPGANMNVFANESQVDAMAAAAGVDPLTFRLRHLADPRLRRVLEAAASAFGWRPAAGPSGRGIGIACSIDAGTCVAAFAQVEVDRSTGRVRVGRIVCAQDMGLVVNPLGARMQMEGGLAMGLGYALSEELRFRGGDVLDRNFDTYAVPRMRDQPAIEAVLIDNPALAPQGGGEPAITCTGAVIANAVFDATGARMTRLPMTPARVLAAMAAAPAGPSASG